MGDITHIDIAVRFKAGAYVTPTVRGQRASSTMSDGEAARKLAQKLWGAAAACTHMKNLEAGVYVWRIAPSVGAAEC
jgi:hypothetical protein